MSRNKYRFPDRASAESAYADEAELSLRLGQALRMLADGVRPDRFTVKGRDGDRFTLRYIPGFCGSTGRPSSDGVVLFTCGGSVESWALADSFLRDADREVSTLGAEYAAFEEMRRWLRGRIAASMDSRIAC